MKMQGIERMIDDTEKCKAIDMQSVELQRSIQLFCMTKRGRIGFYFSWAKRKPQTQQVVTGLFILCGTENPAVPT